MRFESLGLAPDVQVRRLLLQGPNRLEVALLLAWWVLGLSGAQLIVEAVKLDSLEQIPRLALLLRIRSGESSAVPEVRVVRRIRIQLGHNSVPARRVLERLESMLQVEVAVGLEVGIRTLHRQTPREGSHALRIQRTGRPQELDRLEVFLRRRLEVV